ncbi:ribonuclease G [Alkalibacillus filiformis]|uniref:Ribonuclease G n=1 Tax=Alkalibacillus filiformis TaxID=200990 RepID=A0ABU0DRS3_9BACI|nr:ribonuclease E/G [Alkalibacillus filiformis]MDQ0351153.1 ribonuclease G [Alkalibacillus filiformis]
MRKIYLQTKTSHQMIYDFEDGHLTNIKYQKAEHLQVGDIVSGIIHQVDKRLKAAFVDIGQSDLAYLAFENVYNGQVHKGERLILQVERLATKTKKASLSTMIQLKSDALVYLPLENSINISNKLNTDEQEQLKEKLDHIVDHGGVVARTVAGQLDYNELKQQYNQLKSKWDTVSRHNQSKGVLLKEQNLFSQLLRSVSCSAVDELIVDDLDKVQIYKQSFDHLSHLIQYDRQFYSNKPISITELYELLANRHVKLNNGATITIDQTEALTAIDVDFGSFKDETSKHPPYMDINVKAAKESAKQIRNRNISGAIVIDFLNMKTKREQQMVMNVFREEAENDDAQVHVVGFTRLGMLEVTRKRINENIYQFLGVDERSLGITDAFSYKELEENLLVYEANPDVDCVLVEVQPHQIVNWKAMIERIAHHHRFHFECYISQNGSLHTPYKLYKIGDVNWLLSRQEEGQLNIDKVF